MRGKMYKLTGTGLFGKSPKIKRGKDKTPAPVMKRDTISDHLPKTDTVPILLPDKLRGK